MKIRIITPAAAGSLKGNRVTAERWRQLLRKLGHRVTIATDYAGEPCDVLIALHARRSYRAIARCDTVRPRVPIVLALTGTDLYGDIHTNQQSQRALSIAARLVLLQPDGLSQLSPALRQKTRVIYQSATAPKKIPATLKSCFEVVVIGHLRPVKDPFRAAMASAALPTASRIQIVHIGAALSAAMRRRADRLAADNPRYRWLGELSRRATLGRLARSRLLVVTSKLEGGANVVSEALAAEVPVLSSRISGSIGILGGDYPGYFPVGDTAALTALLARAETDQAFYRRLQAMGRRRARLLTPEREMRAWKELLDELEARE